MDLLSEITISILFVLIKIGFSVIDISEHDVNEAVDSFCNAAGVIEWEKF